MNTKPNCDDIRQPAARSRRENACARRLSPHRRQGRLLAAGRLREAGDSSETGSSALADDLAALHMRESATCWSSPPARSRSAARCSACRAGRSSSRTARPPPRSARSRWRAPGREALSRHGIIAGQVLVTLGDTEERRRYLNARSTIDTLLEWRAVPVINENDTVATNEIRYGDNDRLAARVATMASADLLVLLSDVDGLYDAPPDRDASARAHPVRRRASRPRSRRWPAAPASELSRGGMQHQDRGGAGSPRWPAPIWSSPTGALEHPLRAIAEGARCTWFLTAGQSGDGAQEVDRRRARAQGHAGRSTPARSRRCAGGKSLLPAGVVTRRGRFRARRRGDHPRSDGAEIGRGLCAYDAEDAQKIRGRASAAIESILGFRGRAEMVHRDDLVVGRE